MTTTLRQILEIAWFVESTVVWVCLPVGAGLVHALNRVDTSRGRAQGAPLRRSKDRYGALRRSLIVLGALLAISTGLRAQDAASTDADADAAQRSARTAEAVSLALDGKDAEAEFVLRDSLRHAADSAVGHLELGSRLVRVALECASNGNAEAADAAASRALEHFASARKAAGSDPNGIAASAWRMEAFVHLELRGDREAALAAYLGAEALAPDDIQLKSKRERLEREMALDAQRNQEVVP